MPFIPHLEADVKAMFDEIGIANINQLFDEIPEALKTKAINLPVGLSEMAATRLIKDTLKNSTIRFTS